MFRLKLHKPLYLLALLASLFSFSGVVNTIPVEKTTIELLLIRTSENKKLADYNDGLFKSSVKSIQSFSIYFFSGLLNFEQHLAILEYSNFKVKYIPFQKILPILKYQYHSSFMDIEFAV